MDEPEGIVLLVWFYGNRTALILIAKHTISKERLK
jgi:hypothetical protein